VLPGDEVIVPSLTFIAPINAVAYNGAYPIFMDCDRHYNIDVEKLINFITDQTIFKNGISINKSTNNRISAIIPVHIWGNAVDMSTLQKICKERNIVIIEDASESLGTIYNSGIYNNVHTGLIGDLGCISFNGNKIITTGGGGVIITNNSAFAEKAKYLTTQAKDDPINYIHDDIGYNFRITNVQAAIGVAQFEQLPGFIKKKNEIHKNYKNQISKIDGLSIAACPSFARNNNWVNILQIDFDRFSKNKSEIMFYLEKNGIQTRPVWGLNHQQKPYAKFQSYDISKAIDLLDCSLLLPSSPSLTNENIDYIRNILDTL